MNNNVNGNNVPTKKNSFGKIFGKVYLICIGISIGLFFLMSIIKVIISITTGADVNSNVLLRLVQVALPMYLVLFGWIPASIIAAIKYQKK